MSTGKVVLYGATGFTGGLIADLLARDGWEFVLGGRNQERLRELATKLEEKWERSISIAVAAVDQPDELDAMLTDAKLLINVAGPFSELGRPLVEAALRTKTHYLDTSGEQLHIRWVEEQHDDARRKGIVLMPAAAFEFALGDLAAEIAWAQAASRIVVAYVVDDMKMSHGTKKSIVRAMGEKGLTFIGGEHVEKKVGYHLFDVPILGGDVKKGAWVPGGEAITVPRRGGVSRVETCVVVGEGAAYFMATVSGLLPSLLRAVRPVADKMVDQTSGNPHKAGGEHKEFSIVAFDPKNSQVFVILWGDDLYWTTAKIIVEAARRIIGADLPTKGFVGPADLFEVDEFLEAIDIEVIRPQ